MATKEKTFYTYDELSDDAKKTALEWWASKGCEFIQQIEIDDGLASAEKTLESIGAEPSKWSIGAWESSYMEVSPSGGALREMAYALYYDYEHFVEEGERVPECPVMKSDGYFIGEGMAEKWNSDVVPAVNAVVSDLNSMIAERDVNEDMARVFANKLDKLAATIEDGLSEIGSKAANDIQTAAEWVESEEYFEGECEANEYWFDEYGNPEG